MGLNRRGIIGFVLTMALGAALGAAAFVVGNEVNKEKKTSRMSVSTNMSNAITSQTKVKEAFSKYELAFNNYKIAVAQGRPDVNVYAEKLRAAKKSLETQMKSTSSQTTQEPQNTESNNNYADPVADNMFNPFSGRNVKIDNTRVLQQAAENANVGNSSSVNGDRTSSRNTVENAAADAGNVNESADNTGDSSTKEPSSLGYYRVKSGDTLSKICKKYYGDSGMWTHILKYQIPSIAATPNLIFPGQLIALPRKATGFKAWVAKTNGKVSGWKDKVKAKSSNKNGTAPAGDESWQNGFNDEYVVSDHTLTDSGSLSVSQIQSFLEYKGSVLAKPYNGSSPAKMIYNAAKKYGISPKVLLTRLQCEQSLISAKTASRKKLDWALGVGCYDSGNWNQKYKGFDKQIEYAASTYRRHYDNAASMLKSGKRLNMRIDGKRIQVKNAASYAFYKYCPHFAGNKLFIDVWNGYKKHW